MLTKTKHNSKQASINGDVHQARKHDSANLHVSGEARYIDDIPEPEGCLHVYIAQSEHAHADIIDLNLDAVRDAPGVACVVAAVDIPGKNNVGPVIHDEPLFATNIAHYHGQSLFAVAATSRKAARLAAMRAVINYAPHTHLVSIGDAKEANATIEACQTMRMGNASDEISRAPCRVKGQVVVGGQDHFYLEGQIALAIPGEDNNVHIHSSTQNPTETQHLVAEILNLLSHNVTVEVRRMGGAFGGKETQSTLYAAIAALCAMKTGRAVKVRADRDDDMVMTGKRHDFEIGYEAGFDQSGILKGVQIDLASRCGFSTDLSMAINDRAMFHSDNCYFLGAAEINSQRYRTHTVSNTAFRGFGGPQGMVGIERLMDEIAFSVGRDPLDVRLDNLYREGGRDITPYHQTVEDFVARTMMIQLAEDCDYRARRAAIEVANLKTGTLKRGIALTPVKFGISFTTTHLNQAGAFINVYADGSIQLNHGGTEMGQGLMVKVAQIVAHEFQIDIDRIRIMSTSTEKVPNTSATAASSGSDLNGMAAKMAAQEIKQRLIAFLAERDGLAPSSVTFSKNSVMTPDRVYSFEEVVKAAYFARISLSATGFYKTPKIHYDRKTHRGRPFYYFSYGAAVSEVEIDILTGENRVIRTDILHEVGKSLNPAIDIGQIEGGFIQGQGWLTTEELVYDDMGRLKTHAPSTYKIPTCGDRPDIFNVEIWQDGQNVERTIHRSKAVGEPPFMLAISVLSAISHAISGSAGHKVFGDIDAPATPERILFAVMAAQSKAGI